MSRKSFSRTAKQTLISRCRVVQTYPDLDCVFLNSGTQSQMKVTQSEEIDLDAFHRDFQVNYTSIVNLALRFLPHLQKKNYPTAMVVTGSTLAVVPAFAMPSYSASKAALKAFFESLRQQYQGVSQIKFIEILPPAVQSKQPRLCCMRPLLDFESN